MNKTVTKLSSTALGALSWGFTITSYGLVASSYTLDLASVVLEGTSKLICKPISQGLSDLSEKIATDQSIEDYQNNKSPIKEGASLLLKGLSYGTTGTAYLLTAGSYISHGASVALKKTSEWTTEPLAEKSYALSQKISLNLNNDDHMEISDVPNTHNVISLQDLSPHIQELKPSNYMEKSTIATLKNIASRAIAS